jgi:PDZ domain
MSSFNILACTSLLLLCAASATAQDTQPAPRPAPRLLLRQPGEAPHGGPRMREGGPRLGVSVESTPDGLKIGAVDEGSLAASAGLAAGDVLMRIGERRVHEIDDVALALHDQQVGAKVSITVVRPGEGLLTLEGTLPERAEEPRAAAPDGMKGGFLGVQMQTDGGGQCGGGGVAVAGVVPDSAAWFAGLQEGDCLLAIDGKTLAGPEDLAGAVAAKEPGTLVELRFVREGAEQTTKVRLGHQGAFGHFGGMGRPGAFGPNILRLRAPRSDDDDAPFIYDLDTPDGRFKMHDGNFDFGTMPDLESLFAELHDRVDTGGSASVEVRIEDDHMTVTHDGVTETYQRDADGNWIKQAQDAAAPGAAAPDDC